MKPARTEGLSYTARERTSTLSPFRCVKGVCVLQGTIRGQVGRLTMAQQLRTGQYCGNRAPRLLGKDGDVWRCSIVLAG